MKRRHRTNRFPSPCAACGAHVDADQGTLRGKPGDWSTVCQKCLPFPSGAEGVVALSRCADGFSVKLDGYLGSTFNAYRAAKEGLTSSVNVDGEWHTTGKVADCPELIRRLQTAGIKVSVDERLRVAIEEMAAASQADSEAAGLRLQRVEAELAKTGGALFPFQRDGVKWLAPRDRAILADEMGLGKTVQALVAAPADAPILVVCPAVAKGVWVREAAKWRPNLRPVALKGRGSFRWPAPGEMVITNYAILPPDVLADDIDDAPSGCVLIADEAHALKNYKTKRNERFNAIKNEVRRRAGRVWLLTATPMLNKPQELWSLLQAADLRESFGSWSGFARAFGGARGRYGWEWFDPTPKAAELLARVQLRRLKKEVEIELPAKRWQRVEVELDGKTRRVATEAVEATGWTGLSGELPSRPAFEEMSRARAALARAKVKSLLALVESYENADEPLVVFSAHRAPVDALGEREGWATITGDTAPAERSRIEDRFQAGELRGVAATIQAGGVAITLTRASTAVMVDRLFTPALNAQAEDRIHRIGQKRGVLIIDLVADHDLDRRLYEILVEKQAMIDASVNEAAGAAALEDMAKLVEESRAFMTAVEFHQDDYDMLVRVAEKMIRARGRENKENKWAANIADRLRARGLSEGTPFTDNVRRDAAGEAEEWAIGALETLASWCDGAEARDGAGFSKTDAFIGPEIVRRYHAEEGLTDAEWVLAHGIAWKYPRQVGRPGQEAE